jgi:hypothetical protein
VLIVTIAVAVSDRPAAMPEIDADPDHPTQLSFSSVWIEASKNTAMAATATKTAVHVPCSLMAFKAILWRSARTRQWGLPDVVVGKDKGSNLRAEEKKVT